MVFIHIRTRLPVTKLLLDNCAVTANRTERVLQIPRSYMTASRMRRQDAASHLKMRETWKRLQRVNFCADGHEIQLVLVGTPCAAAAHLLFFNAPWVWAAKQTCAQRSSFPSKHHCEPDNVAFKYRLVINSPLLAHSCALWNTSDCLDV